MARPKSGLTEQQRRDQKAGQQTQNAASERAAIARAVGFSRICFILGDNPASTFNVIRGPPSWMPSSYVPTTDPNTQFYDFLQQHATHRMDWLLLHNFFNPSAHNLTKKLYESYSMKVGTDFNDSVYSEIVTAGDIHQIATSMDVSTFAVPHVLMVIAMVIGSLFGCQVAFVRQSTYLTAATSDAGKLAKVLSANFDIVVDGHDRSLYETDYLGFHFPLIETYLNHLSLLSCRYDARVYPPAAMTSRFQNKSIRNAAIRRVKVPFYECSFPLVPPHSVDEKFPVDNNLTWETVSWKNLFNHLPELSRN